MQVSGQQKGISIIVPFFLQHKGNLLGYCDLGNIEVSSALICYQKVQWSHVISYNGSISPWVFLLLCWFLPTLCPSDCFRACFISVATTVSAEKWFLSTSARASGAVRRITPCLNCASLKNLAHIFLNQFSEALSKDNSSPYICFWSVSLGSSCCVKISLMVHLACSLIMLLNAKGKMLSSLCSL